MVDDLRKAVNIYRRRRDGLSERLRDVALVVCVLQEWDRSRHLNLCLLAATLAGATLVASAICGWGARFATSTGRHFRGRPRSSSDAGSAGPVSVGAATRVRPERVRIGE